MRDAFKKLQEQGKFGSIKATYAFVRTILKFGENEQLFSGVHLPELQNLLPGLKKCVPRKMLDPQLLPALINRMIDICQNGKKQDHKNVKIILLLLLTACRANEIIKVQPTELVANWLIIPPERMKAKKEHRVYIPQQILPLVNHENTSLSQLNYYKKVKFADFSFDFHGFRSLFLTIMFEKFPQMQDALSACLAHGKNHSNEADRFYNRYQFDKEKEFLYCQWFKYLMINTRLEHLLKILLK
ncbi:hypothetical protein CJP74_06120 [Psittacicella melopsittaci]|uniref:Integrase n=1 Tax=Psittacicella melopsittaci TaxID=2028576 RepID=A0A3A1Y2R7_9GAMM|nr:hypothetical protein [Psittacicella melopsittaci]RIY31855.1 hypothetical protein CJP74_06120 [Psittacicella melopsittaci]